MHYQLGANQRTVDSEYPPNALGSSYVVDQDAEAHLHIVWFGLVLMHMDQVAAPITPSAARPRRQVTPALEPVQVRTCSFTRTYLRRFGRALEYCSRPHVRFLCLFLQDNPLASALFTFKRLNRVINRLESKVYRRRLWVAWRRLTPAECC
jgi:hypothetical protein